MKTGSHTSNIIRIIGDVLLVLVILLTVDIVIVMLHKSSYLLKYADETGKEK